MALQGHFAIPYGIRFPVAKCQGPHGLESQSQAQDLSYCNANRPFLTSTSAILTTGLVRILSNSDIECQSASAKEGLRVGMVDPCLISTYTMHTDTSIWGLRAHQFRPERWIRPDGGGSGRSTRNTHVPVLREDMGDIELELMTLIWFGGPAPNLVDVLTRTQFDIILAVIFLHTMAKWLPQKNLLL